MERKWVAYFFLSSLHEVSLGFHIDLRTLNIEIHLPFGFLRVGRAYETLNPNDFISKKYGYDKGWKWGQNH